MMNREVNVDQKWKHKGWFLLQRFYFEHIHIIYIYIRISDDLNLILLAILVNWQMDAHLIQTTQIKQ
jgi:hypothetical protein